LVRLSEVYLVAEQAVEHIIMPLSLPEAGTPADSFSGLMPIIQQLQVIFGHRAKYHLIVHDTELCVLGEPGGRPVRVSGCQSACPALTSRSAVPPDDCRGSPGGAAGGVMRLAMGHPACAFRPDQGRTRRATSGVGVREDTS
jgi:hypothetical protein